jgi:hypothetical protein
MRVFIVEDGVAINSIVIDDSASPEEFSAVDLGEYAEIGDTVVDNVSQQAAQREIDAKDALYRDMRDNMLRETDWWVLSDTAPATQEQLDYRQALRDLPDQEGYPDVDFPTKP